ncbi:MAG: ExbD/TolR family protein [Chitinophagales bacterium]|jgi:biopolymer transport protein ExbD
MAEIQEQGGGGGKDGKARSKKMSTKVDLTAMVDLAFLLITFFMLTTTLSKPNIMPIIMPEKKDINEEDLEATKESQVLTLLLGGNDKVYFYEGITNAVLDSTDFSAEGLRAKILDKKDRVKAEWGEDEKDDPKNPGQKKMVSKLNVIIKPTKESRYKNLVDTFDEMKICNIGRYVMLDISTQEENFIKNPAGGLQFSVEDQLEAAKGK